MKDSKRKRKILFVTNVDWFFISHRLPLALHALDKGYEVFLLTLNTGYKDELIKKGIRFINIPFQRAGSNPFHELKCVFLLFKHYKKLQPDIIHHITLKASLLGSISAKMANNLNVVNAISGFGYNFTDNRNGLTQKIIRLLIRFAFKNKKFSFILQNPDDFQMIEDLDLTRKSNIYLIKGSGVKLSEYDFSRTSESKKLKILFPARILADKGVIEFIEAAKLLYNDYKDRIVFILAGDCDTENPAVIKEKELINMLIPSYIEWIGFQKNMISVYKDSDIVVLPSYREGLPKSLIEACSTGRPIVTTNVPGCKECVVDGFNGYLVPAKDSVNLAQAIKKLIDNKGIRDIFGINSRKMAEEEFSIDLVIEKTFTIYDHILNR